MFFAFSVATRIFGKFRDIGERLGDVDGILIGYNSCLPLGTKPFPVYDCHCIAAAIHLLLHFC